MPPRASTVSGHEKGMAMGRGTKPRLRRIKYGFLIYNLDDRIVAECADRPVVGQDGIGEAGQFSVIVLEMIGSSARLALVMTSGSRSFRSAAGAMGNRAA